MKPLSYKIVVFAALGLAPFLSACPALDANLAGPEVAPVRIVDTVAEQPSDPFTVDAHRLSGHKLEVDVQYSGGCQTHEFVGYVGSAIAESSPVQMSGRIAHDDRDDECDAIVSGTIAFDLSPLRDLFRTAYGIGSSTIILHLAPITAPIRYTF